MTHDDAIKLSDMADDLLDASERRRARVAERMREMLGPPELMGAFEACQELGVSSGNLYKLAGLPEPVQRIKAGALWRAADIRELARQRAEG